MGTSLNEVYDLFMQQVTDYRLFDLFNTSETDFETHLQAYLEFAIVDFKHCDQDLNYDSITLQFPVTLTRENKVILATLMMKRWLRKNINDITQMNLHVTDRVRVASEAVNLREKKDYLLTVEEHCSQMLNDYDWERVSWSNWFNQNFSG